ncbi:hypothetical protein VTN96DRAFT_6168 [Rasamsonia emersonii]
MHAQGSKRIRYASSIHITLQDDIYINVTFCPLVYLDLADCYFTSNTRSTRVFDFGDSAVIHLSKTVYRNSTSDSNP